MQGDVNWCHLVVGDHNAAQAGIAANEKTDIARWICDKA
ncbi:vacuolating cytotoxin vacA fragment 4 [Helicobacter acinonychis str. Sheeba]|uniref:Vacuolating cytotoxin 4 n=2 Tax=Helicobacter acinonychis TaxID=212 RepID=Q17WG9_HELAH|nr:vacuolating cytotoxin fragment 4 [Helicobacter acinonychis str. Sheeba]CAK00007.1 vacuolating cytotoxin vacA fragment 4 [Helicobacter acinonychis str. Sheeba]SFZ70625.1 OMP744 [Helicobacter acinonychis]